MAAMKTVTSAFLKRVYPERDKWSHKGDSGRVLIIGGSRRYRGAPALCGLAALRSGADVVTIAAPESAADVIASFSPNLITEPLVGDYLNMDDLGRMLALARRADAVVIGNGLGRMKSTGETVLGFLRKLGRPCVIDADALHMLTGNPKVLKKGWIITPHELEFYNLSGHRLTRELDKRAGEAIKFSKEFKATVLLKGYKDVIAEGGKALVNSTGNPYMTVGGTGDVLAGVCGAFLAMGMKSADAALAAAYICGDAGDTAAREKGPGLVATDVIERIPYALKKIVI